MGVEWSPDGKILASCSLDGTICFWNADPSSSQTLIGKIERAHAGFIKGLAWDPTGRFLASQSDDGSCVVWNMECMLKSQLLGTSFSLDPSESEMFKETVLERMFVNMSKMTFFHRPGWSPDGTLLALANATNRQIPAVALIERSNWHGPGTFFIGHLGPVEAVRFCPKLYKRSSSKTDNLDKNNYEMLCALASQDGQVSIWSSAKTSPLLVLQDLFEHSVMDLAWTPDGNVLIAVSYDGAAVVIRIDSSEFGLIVLSEAEQNEYFKNICGNRFNGSDDSGKNGYLENVKVIECLRENEQFLSNHPVSKDPERPQSPIMSRMELGPVDPALSAQNTNTAILSGNSNINVIQTSIVNGKKRITPQLINIADSSVTSSQSQPQQARFVSARLKDEDFIVSRKLLERSAGLLVKSSQSSRGVFEIETPTSETPTNLSVSLACGPFFTVSIEITNYDICGRKAASLLQFVQNSQIVWKERIRGTVYASAGGRKYSAFALQGPGESAKHFLLVLTAAGRRHLPLISMDSQIIYLSLSSRAHLSAVTANGSVYIWDLQASKIKFSDSTISIGDEIAKFIDFDPEKLLITYTLKDDVISKIEFNSNLGFWIGKPASGLSSSSLSVSAPASVNSIADRAVRIEKLKTVMLNSPDSFVDRQLSELEFELSLIFVNLRNGIVFSNQESSHFERILAIYAIKLAKEGKTLKASELMQDLIDLNQEFLIQDLLKPFFTSSSAAYSSHWQDFISSNFK